MDTIKREALREYLDDAITHWRATRDAAKTAVSQHTADCYVDAFQSVRVSMLGELLPETG